MISFSSLLVGFINLITLIISVPLLRIGWWFRTDGTAEPLRFLQYPFLLLGLLMLVLSLLGFFGACCQVSSFLGIYVFVLFLIMTGLFCFMIFAFVVTSKTAAQAISGVGVEEYRLGDYSNWLRDEVSDGDNWSNIVIGLKEAKVCSKTDYALVTQVYKWHLMPIQVGCCKPPMVCGFTYVNATYWTVPTPDHQFAVADCKAWSNDQDVLCYQCVSCKTGVLENIRNVWHEVSLYLTVLLLLLNIMYSIGYCALKSSRAHEYRHYRGPYYY